MAEIESPYDFRDPALAAAWAEDIRADEAWRAPFFTAIAAALAARPGGPLTVMELGSGPGHLARAILTAAPDATYTAVDYSPAMHALAAAHLGDLAAHVRFETRDFRRPDWTAGLGPFDAAVTIMAAHEVRASDRLQPLFAQVLAALKPGGVFLFADFHATDPDHAGLYLPREAQRAALLAAGFTRADLLLDHAGMALWAAT